MDEIPEYLGAGRAKRGEDSAKFRPVFQRTGSHCSKGLGRKEQPAPVTPTVLELTRKMLSTLEGRGRGVGSV